MALLLEIAVMAVVFELIVQLDKFLESRFKDD